LHSKNPFFAAIPDRYSNPIQIKRSKASLCNDDNVREFNGFFISVLRLLTISSAIVSLEPEAPYNLSWEGQQLHYEPTVSIEALQL